MISYDKHGYDLAEEILELSIKNQKALFKTIESDIAADFLPVCGSIDWSTLCQETGCLTPWTLNSCGLGLINRIAMGPSTMKGTSLVRAFLYSSSPSRKRYFVKVWLREKHNDSANKSKSSKTLRTK